MLARLALLLAAPLWAQERPMPVDILTPIDRYLASMRLGDTLEKIRSIYPPVKEWPSYDEPGSSMTRVDILREQARAFPAHVSFIRLSLREGRVRRIVLVYDKRQSRRKPLDKLVRELSLKYGEPRRRDLRYWWRDKGTVVLAAYAELPSKLGAVKELRPSLELMDSSVFEELYP